jgi:spore maturation protein CgeB
MRFVVFGLSVSSSWGNGHATLWRGLCAALGRRGHLVSFFERDRPFYAAHRDLTELPGGQLIIYSDWSRVAALARKHLSEADTGIVTSYCPDAIEATDLMLESSTSVRAFYDLDTPVTLDRVRKGLPVAYIGPRGLRDFDLVLSYTGGAAVTELKTRLGAQWVEPLYGSVDPSTHSPVSTTGMIQADLSYLGTYAADRQHALEELFVRPARGLPRSRFLMAGAQYPQTFPWSENIFFIEHVRPSDHPAFYCSSRLTLNVTREAMAEMGYCPSGRLFEAAACGAPILSDTWKGLEEFFSPGAEILTATSSHDTLAAMELSDEELSRIARAGRERTLQEHTADQRALTLELAIQHASSRRISAQPPVPATTHAAPNSAS